MTTVSQTKEATMVENFADLFEQSIKAEKREGTVVQGIITGITEKEVFVDVGLKSEGRIHADEFAGVEISVGSKVDVFIERMEDRYGNTVLSRDKALKEDAWFKFEDLHKQNVTVEGKIIGRVKGGFAVDLGRIIAFLPGSQVDIRPIKDISPLIELPQPFKILKMDRNQGNVVVSRRAILEESRAEARESLLANISEGSILEGTVKNITDYGAFIDLGSIDGLLHITDISWSKISHPSEVLSLGQQMKVVVIKYNEETKRVSLGLKQMEKNPWDGIADKYQAGTKLTGTVTTITDYGAFVEFEPHVEGLVYHTEISWNAKNVHPRKLLKTGDKVDVVVLEFDIAKHKISLSMKQCKENPWQKFGVSNPIGSEVAGVVQNVADFGVFILIGEAGTDEAVEALVPAVELSWEEKPETELKKYSKGDAVKGMVLAIDPDRERILVSVKQLSQDHFSSTITDFNKGDIVTCSVVQVQNDGIEVEVSEGVRTFIKKAELSKHKSEQKPERFGIGDKLDAKITILDPKDRKFGVSIKALEVDEEKKAIAEYGSKDSGASLGEILGMALNKDKGTQE
ncbi:MAG: 30S ribosomal protein S1 [Alphaproteobacteria bacterium]|jgi:small subunit ribosomal protein S1|nr:30S ribosomal protein S1 [Candidatus Jidaibacter sp.]